MCAGRPEAIDRLGEVAKPITRAGPLVIVGDGELAQKVSELLSLAGEEIVHFASEPVHGASRVGDTLDPAELQRAGVTSAQAVILALENDSTTLFASAIVRNLTRETAIIASVDRAANIGRIRRAGADFALSVSQVAGQLLTFHVLGEESVELESQLRLVKVAPGALVGENPSRARIGERTGCSIVAVERRDAVMTGFDERFAFTYGDQLYLCGSPESIHHFFEVFPGTRPVSSGEDRA